MNRTRLFTTTGVMLGLCLIFAVLANGCKCNCAEKDCNCTEVFMSYSVTVTDKAKLPITDAQVTVWFEASGETVDCSEMHNRAQGEYCVMSDTYRKSLDEDGETVIVRFTAPGYKTLTEDYLFSTDDCQCHIRHIYGPAAVVLEKD